MQEQARLIQVEGQDAIPGLAAAHQPPLMVQVPDLAPADPDPNQAALFGPTQPELKELPPQPQQLSMLPEPAIWEEAVSAGTPSLRKGRLAKRRTRAGISPGQTSFF